jgi:membrane protease YdiL (CAAX protease family)
MDNPRTKITIFLGLTIALSMIAWVPIVRAGTVGIGGGYYTLGAMWCPGIAAILTRLITQRNLSGMGWIPRTPKLLGLAYILPFIYALPVYLFVWGTGLGGFNPGSWATQPGASPVTGILLILTLGMIKSLMSATGEEIGWRGLLVPELAKITNFRTTALISGLVWASWHMPLALGADYHGKGTPLLYSVLCFYVMAVSLSFIMAWAVLRSGGFWPAALLHASHNLFVQAVFDSATVERASTNWWIGEFGAGLAITISVVAYVILRGSRIEDLEAIDKPAAGADRPARRKAMVT